MPGSFIWFFGSMNTLVLTHLGLVFCLILKLGVLSDLIVLSPWRAHCSHFLLQPLSPQHLQSHTYTRTCAHTQTPRYIHADTQKKHICIDKIPAKSPLQCWRLKVWWLFQLIQERQRRRNLSEMLHEKYFLLNSVSPVVLFSPLKDLGFKTKVL